MVPQLHIDALKRACRLLDDLSQTQPPERTTRFTLLTWLVARRASRWLTAMEVLIDRGLDQEALVLTRSLYELGLNYRYICSGGAPDNLVLSEVTPEQGAEFDREVQLRAAKFLAFSWVELSMKLTGKFPAITVETDVVRLATEAEAKFQYTASGQRWPTWSGKSVAKMAQSLGKSEELRYELVYRESSSLSHQGPYALMRIIAGDEPSFPDAQVAVWSAIWDVELVAVNLNSQMARGLDAHVREITRLRETLHNLAATGSDSAPSLSP